MYSYEIWSRSGSLVADLTRLATDRKFSASRNEAEEVSFKIDAKALKEYADGTHQTAAGILGVGSNEIRVKRDDTYLLGARVESYTVGDGDDKTIDVIGRGFLNMLKDRMLEKQRIFTAEEASMIIWTVIDEMQTGSSAFWDTSTPVSASYADLGITQGTLDTIGDKDRTYEIGKNVKDVLVQMTELQTTATDVYFTYDKVLNVVSRQGSDKPGVIFELGDNITSYTFPFDGQEIANRIITTGSGSEGGGTLVTSIVQDTGSQASHQIRQHLQQFNAVSEQDTLDDHGNGYMQATKDPIRTPELDVDLNDRVTIDDFWIGDRIMLKLGDDELPVDPSGLYRVEKIDMDIDDEDKETAKLTVS